jgi:hypothetical protein
MKYFLCLIILLSITRCAPLYIPNKINTPFFEKKNDAVLTVAASQGAEVQAAYSLGNHTGIIANGMIVKKEESSKYTRHRLLEAGVGYYGKLNSLFAFDAFAGAGVGTGSAGEYANILSGPYREVYARYQKVFVQSSLQFNSDRFSNALSVRCSRIDYRNEIVIEDGALITDKLKSEFFVDMAVSGRYRLYKKLHVLGQFNYVLNSPDSLQYNFTRAILSVGVQVNIPITKR